MNKFCVNCIHHKSIHPHQDNVYNFCLRETKTNLVTGKVYVDRKRCEQERQNKESSDACGPQAKYFKEKL